MSTSIAGATQLVLQRLELRPRLVGEGILTTVSTRIRRTCVVVCASLRLFCGRGRRPPLFKKLTYYFQRHTDTCPRYSAFTTTVTTSSTGPMVGTAAIRPVAASATAADPQLESPCPCCGLRLTTSSIRTRHSWFSTRSAPGTPASTARCQVEGQTQTDSPAASLAAAGRVLRGGKPAASVAWQTPVPQYKAREASPSSSDGRKCAQPTRNKPGVSSAQIVSATRWLSDVLAPRAMQQIRAMPRVTWWYRSTTRPSIMAGTGSGVDAAAVGGVVFREDDVACTVWT